ncbi:MAG: hypothetical protein GY754_04305 [bacterium]|nr:hypothetical protein [bacterium]
MIQLMFKCPACSNERTSITKGLKALNDKVPGFLENTRLVWEQDILWKCDCGSEMDYFDFFELAWKQPELHEQLMLYVNKVTVLPKDDSWSFAALALPGREIIAMLEDTLFELYLSYAKNADYDHFSDDRYEVIDVLDELQKTNPTRGKQLLEILQKHGSGHIDEQLAEQNLLITMYNFDIFREAISTNVIEVLKENLQGDIPIRSIHILRGQVCYWPDRCLWVDAGDKINELILDPVRENCAVPPTVDEADAVFDYLVENFPDMESEFELKTAGTLMYRLLRTVELTAAQSVFDYVNSGRYKLSAGFVVLYEESSDFSLRYKPMMAPDFYHDDIKTRVNSLFDSGNKLDLFTKACYHHEQERQWLINFYDS